MLRVLVYIALITILPNCAGIDSQEIDSLQTSGDYQEDIAFNESEGSYSYDGADLASAAEAAEAAPPPSPTQRMRAAKRVVVGSAPASRSAPIVSATSLNQLTPKNRKVHYDGSIRVQAKDPRASLKQVIEWAVEAGGFVESQSLNHATLQIPVKQFFEIYSRALKIGTLISKSLTARDLTDSIADMNLRRDLIKRSLDKLQSMLKTAKSVAERLTLLSEIKRLREKLAIMDANLAQLEKLASFSKLDFWVQPQKSTFASLSLRNSFKWIGMLAPYSKRIATINAPFEWKYPKGFIELPDDDAFIVESSSKVQIRSSLLENNPKGTSNFWTDAIVHALKQNKNKSWQKLKLNNFNGLIITDRLDSKTTYLIALDSSQDEIRLIETVYPSKAEKDRFHSAVTKAISSLPASE